MSIPRGAATTPSATARAFARMLGGTDRTWMDQAWCRGQLSFTEIDPHEAKKQCRQHCPVVMQCLTWALHIEAQLDLHRVLADKIVYGGCTSHQRVQMINARRRTAAA